MVKFEIYAWEPSVSPHKLALYRALRDAGEVSSVTYIAQADLPEARKQQGWSRGDLNDLNVLISPSSHEIDALVARADPNAIHIFSGVHWSAVIAAGLKAVLKARRRFGVMSEPRANEGLKGVARLAHSWLTEGAYRQHADFILAIGRNGPPWFERTGYGRARIFPFAYFLPPPSPIASSSPELPKDVLQILYLGRLEAEKGVHLVLEARNVCATPAQFCIAGGGALRDLAESEAVKPGPPLRVLGPVPMAQTSQLLAAADIVCAPSISTNDGWCAVVSEALMAGAAVITTPKVGASICLEQDERLGMIVDTNGLAIAHAIGHLVESGALTPASRAWRRAWAMQRLTAEAGARALLNILIHVYSGAARPAPFYA